MLTLLQKQLNEQEAEVIREREKASLERDTDTRVHNQLLTQIEILERAKMRSSDVEESHPSPLRTIDTAYMEDSRRRHRFASHFVRNIPMRASLLSPRKCLASRISWRWSGSRSTKTRRNLALAQDPPSCGYLILLFRRRSHSTGS